MADLPIVALSGTQLNQTPVLVDDVTGLITVPTTLPVNQNHLATKEYVDRSVAGFISEEDLAAAVATLAPESEILRLQDQLDEKATTAQLSALDSAVLKLVGGTMSGPILYTPAPVAATELVNKTYVDGLINTSTGGALTQAQADARYLQLVGGTVTGPITLPAADPTGSLDAVPKSYVDARVLNPALYVDVAGDTMTGPLYLKMAAEPAAAEAVTKQYVDGQVDLLGPGAALLPYYASGVIPIHLSRFGFTLVGNAVTGAKNRGSGGATYDALTQGAALPYADGMMKFGSGAFLRLANPIDIFGKRVIMALNADPPRAANEHFLGDGQNPQQAVRINGSTTGRIVVLDNETGSLSSRVVTSYLTWAGTVVAEFGINTTTSNYEFYRRGTQSSTSSLLAADTQFMLNSIGDDGINGMIFSGRMGEVFVLDAMAPDFAAALSTVRNYLAQAYGLVLDTVGGSDG